MFPLVHPSLWYLVPIFSLVHPSLCSPVHPYPFSLVPMFAHVCPCSYLYQCPPAAIFPGTYSMFLQYTAISIFPGTCVPPSTLTPMIPVTHLPLGIPISNVCTLHPPSEPICIFSDNYVSRYLCLPQYTHPISVWVLMFHSPMSTL